MMMKANASSREKSLEIENLDGDVDNANLSGNCGHSGQEHI